MRDISSDTSSDDNYEPPKTSKSTFFKDKPGSKSSAKNKVQLQFENDTFLLFNLIAIDTIFFHF